jgi:N-methylhydantoinase B
MTTEILRSKLETLSAQMEYQLASSAYSTLMRESRDCSYCLTTPSGARVTDGFSRDQFAIEQLISHHDVQPNDIWISNHPYEIAMQHAPDLLVAVPIYYDGVLLGFSETIAHKSDIGGSMAGSASMVSTEIYQEGLLLPLMKLGEATDDGFELDDRIIRLITANVRDPELFMGDMRAQIGVTLVARRAIQGIAESYGPEVLLGAYEEILRLGERMMRRHLSGWPDGEVTVEAFIDSDGVNRDRPVRFEVVVTKVADTIRFDFSGSDDQTTGPTNIPQAYMESTAVYPPLLSMTEPAASFNSGMCVPVEVIARPGSVFNPRYPAPVGASTTIMFRIRDMVFEALSHFVPDQAVANGGGIGASTAILWKPPEGVSSTRTMQYENLMSAQGASDGHDGCSGCSPSFHSSQITPIEILESQYPLRIGTFELMTDSGGPGKYRGGLSYRREYCCLAPATLNRRADRAKFPGYGVRGGSPGALARLILDQGTERERDVPIAGRYEFEAGESFMGEGAGGGGYGDPFERDPLAVAHDVKIGYVTRDAAERNYGVVLTEDGLVDEAATLAVRSTGSRDGRPASENRRWASV